MGHLVLFLHAHLPYVRHPQANALEEDWLFEAIVDVYLPLLRNLDAWNCDGVRTRLTMSLTPPLVSMLRDELLQQRTVGRLDRLLRLAETEVRRTVNTSTAPLARMYQHRLEAARDAYVARPDLVGAFADHQRSGALEIVASAATHAYLPLFAEPAHARAQIRAGVRDYAETFGIRARGFWLPECGFNAGLEELLVEEGVEYFFVDTHAITNADPPARFGHLRPICTASGAVVFARDPSASESVWSGEIGYPSHPDYRERYRDIGHDLTADRLEGLLLDDGRRRSVGFKYHRITGPDVPLADKDEYDRLAALDAVEAHAEHFVQARTEHARAFEASHHRPAVIVAPYDAELFGHWWFEGPEFINRVVRLIDESDMVAMATPVDVIESQERFQLARPAQSSWGRGGHAQTWLGEKNDWIWPKLHRAADRMAKLAEARPNAVGLERRAIEQLGRELLLASASDWPFILESGTVVEYAERRIRQHLERFDRLHDAIERGAIDRRTLEVLEHEDHVLPGLDPNDFVRT